MLVTPVTLAILVITCVVSFIAFSNARLLGRLVLWPPAVSRERQYDRLLTCGFVHADFGHLLFNMFTFLSFGAYIERLFTPQIGAVGYGLFYAGGIVISALPSYLRHRDDANYRSLGASGAVSAVLFAFILVKPWATLLVFAFPVPAIVFALVYLVYTIYMDRRQTDRINHSAHLWGAVYGVLFTIALDPGVAGRFIEQLLHPRSGAIGL
jgi:membrane associated rhomboid family serine protease